MSRKYVDYKATIWGRLFFEDDADMQKVIVELEKGKLPAELCDEEELKFTEFMFNIDTEEFITPVENDGQATIEVYEGDESFQECIWDNSFESELKRKENEHKHNTES
jgi:hypothetical protein